MGLEKEKIGYLVEKRWTGKRHPSTRSSRSIAEAQQYHPAGFPPRGSNPRNPPSRWIHQNGIRPRRFLLSFAACKCIRYALSSLLQLSNRRQGEAWDTGYIRLYSLWKRARGLFQFLLLDCMVSLIIRYYLIISLGTFFVLYTGWMGLRGREC